MDNPIRIVRELKGAPLSIVMVLMMVKHRVSQEFLERSTGYTDKPISQSLSYLKEAGLIDHTSSGWQLIKGDIFQHLLSPSIDEEPTQSRNNSDPVKLEEEGFINNNLTSATLLNNPEQVGDIPTIELAQQILDAAETLFKHKILGEPREYADVDRLIAWIAQAWHNRGNGRGKIESPAALVYWAFHKGNDTKPEKTYSSDPERYLPECFMQSCGYWIYDDT
jgi:hypothetical protein